MEPSHYVGLDVSQELTSVCVIDEQGAVVWADRGKNHDPAAMTPDLTAASRRARLRQDRCAPLRGGLRPVLTQLLPRADRAWAGTKSGASCRTKSEFGLANWPAIKKRKNAAQPNRKTSVIKHERSFLPTPNSEEAQKGSSSCQSGWGIRP